MEIYLPIAGLSLDIFVLFLLGLVVGVLSGLFVVGGGFLMTPLLILMGIPPAVAVASEANHILAASFSGLLAHIRRYNVDFKMGFILLIGGVLGSAIGVLVLKKLLDIGQEKFFITSSYIIVLASVGIWMLVESINTIKKRRSGKRKRLHEHIWLHGLPFKVRFRKSHLYISVIPPLFIGFFVGILSSIMGVGGGFILVPAMIYILGMPTQIVVGTSLLQIVFVTGVATILHSYVNQTLDVMLSSLLLLGAVIGAQIGTKIMVHLNGEQIRFLLSVIILLVVFVLIGEMVVTPNEMFVIEKGK